MSAWFETISSRMLLERTFVRVREDVVVGPTGEKFTRDVLEVDDAVAILPMFDDGTVVFVRQYRHPLGTSLLEIPAGKLDVSGEDLEAAAHRELAEEVGLAATRLTHLITFANSAGGSTERTHLYRATGLSLVPPPDGFEPKAEEAHMEIVRLPLPDAVRAVRDGVIVDAKTVVALLLAE